MAKQKTRKTPAIETMNMGATAVDIGSREHMAAVNPDVTDAPVRALGTFTHDLHDLADWFKTYGVTSVAMESTGVYWMPAYEILEQHSFEVILVNARYAKNVPGAKPTSVTPVGCDSCIPTVCCAAASGHRPRLPPCGRICANGNGWWICGRPHSAFAESTDGNELAVASR